MSASCSPSGALRPRHWAIILALTLLGEALRMHKLGSQALWLDESYTKAAAQQVHASGYWSVTAVDYISPAYYWVAALASRIGTTDERWLRLPSVIAGTLAIPAVALLAARLTRNTTTACLSAAVVALSPFAIWYSQEARAYMVLMLISCLYLLANLHMLLRGPSIGQALWMAFLGGLGLWFHMAMIFLFAATGMAALITWRLGRGLLVWVESHVISIALYAPWLFATWRPLLKGQPVDSGSLPLRAVYNVFTMLFGQSFGPSVRQIGEEGAVRALSHNLPALALATLALCLCAWNLWRRPPYVPRAGMVLLASGLVMTNLALIANAAITGAAFPARYSITVFPLVAVLVGSALTPRRPAVSRSGLTRLGAGLLLVLAFGWSLMNWYDRPDYAKEDLRSTAEVLRTQLGPDDVLVLGNWNAVPPLEAYGFRCPEQRSLVLRSPGGLEAVAADTAAANGRTFLVTDRQWEVADQSSVMEAFTRAHGKPLTEQHWNGVGLTIWAGHPALVRSNGVMLGCHSPY